MSLAQHSLAAPPAVQAAKHSRLLQTQGRALQQHMVQCRECQGRWFRAAVWVERAHGLLAPRMVTTVAVSAGLLAVFCGWL